MENKRVSYQYTSPSQNLGSAELSGSEVVAVFSWPVVCLLKKRAVVHFVYGSFLREGDPYTYVYICIYVDPKRL